MRGLLKVISGILTFLTHSSVIQDELTFQFDFLRSSKRVMRNREKREISGVRELTVINTADPVAETIEIEP